MGLHNHGLRHLRHRFDIRMVLKINGCQDATGSSISGVDNASMRSSRSRNGFRTTPTSLSDSVTRKTSETSLTHLNGSNTRPANPYQSPSTRVEEPRRSTRNRRAPACDNNDRYFLISYRNRASQNMGGRGGLEGGTAGDNETERTM